MALIVALMPKVEELPADPSTSTPSKKKKKTRKMTQKEGESDEAYAVRRKAARAKRKKKEAAATKTSASKESCCDDGGGCCDDKADHSHDHTHGHDHGHGHDHDDAPQTKTKTKTAAGAKVANADWLLPAKAMGGGCHDGCCDDAPRKERTEPEGYNWYGIGCMLLFFGLPCIIGLMGALEYFGVIAPTPPPRPGAPQFVDMNAALKQWRPVLTDFYQEFNPEKVATVDNVIRKFAKKRGGIPRLMAKLTKKYEAKREKEEASWEERVGL